MFDVFGTVVDWRSSVTSEVRQVAQRKGLSVDAEKFADAWRAGYGPSMNRVRTGDLPWTKLDALHRIARPLGPARQMLGQPVAALGEPAQRPQDGRGEGRLAAPIALERLARAHPLARRKLAGAHRGLLPVGRRHQEVARVEARGREGRRLPAPGEGECFAAETPAVLARQRREAGLAGEQAAPRLG